MKISVTHAGYISALGACWLTDEHPASSHGLPVLVRKSDGQVFRPNDYVGRELAKSCIDGSDVWVGGFQVGVNSIEGDRNSMTQEERDWVDRLVVESILRMEGHWFEEEVPEYTYGQSLRTSDQLAKIEQRLGHKVILTSDAHCGEVTLEKAADILKSIQKDIPNRG